jgi:hypothetical protein
LRKKLKVSISSGKKASKGKKAVIFVLRSSIDDVTIFQGWMIFHYRRSVIASFDPDEKLIFDGLDMKF